MSRIEYLDMVRGKTASLFAAAAEVGAIIAGKPDPVVETAFQRGKIYHMPADTTLRTLGVLESAVISLCRGQYRDVALTTALTAARDVSRTEYLDMVRGKTAALFAAAAGVGAIIAGKPDPVVKVVIR